MRRFRLFLSCFATFAVLAGCSSAPKMIPPQNVTVTVSPSQATLGTFQKQAFSASVTGSTNTAVTWQVNGVTGGAAATGIISASGAYSAPHSIAGSIIPTKSGQPITVTVTAVSQANAAASSTATVTLVPQGQTAENGAVELGTSGGNIHASSTSGNTITCCGGTLGSLIVNSGTNYILSNNHVMADSDAGTIGDAITQPGLIDTKCQAAGTATVANLSQFITLENNPPNPLDAAIAQIVPGTVDTSGNILLLGATTDANGVPVAGPPEAGAGEKATVGLAVAKSGRTTGLTCSTVDTISAMFSVQYQKGCGTGAMFTVNYTGQVSVVGGDFSHEGDSGSLIVRQDTANAVALLFAGSDTNTVGNPIGAVLNAFANNTGVPAIVGGAAHQVIGCTLPLQGATRTLPASVPVSTDAMLAAQAARDVNASRVLSIAGVRGVSVGSSLDEPGQAAVFLFVDPGTPRSSLPVQLDGVRTRIVETSNEAARGILSPEDAQAFAPEQASFAVTSLSGEELARGNAVEAAHQDEWMRQSGVQGFGVTSSADSPGQVALMIFLIRGAAHNPIPVEIDGVRTRVRESSRFRAGLDGLRPRAGCSVPPSKMASVKNVSSVHVHHTHP